MGVAISERYLNMAKGYSSQAISASATVRAIRSALAACFRKNLASFTIARFGASALGRIEGRPKRQARKAGQASRRL
jgi:hypothetical protein